MSSEKFCLRWNDFESNISEAFRELREEKDFLDVTLVCENEQVQAHKVILSACSSFFRNILRRNIHQHPLVYLKGIKFSDLQSVLNFMYQGEVSVAQDELNSFLAVAEDLKVKGLTQNQSENRKMVNKVFEPKGKPDNYPRAQSATPAPRLPPPKHQELYQPGPRYSTAVTPKINVTEDDEIQEVVAVKAEPRDMSTLSSQPAKDIFTPAQPDHALATADDTLEYQDDGYEEYEDYQEPMQQQQADSQQMSATGGEFQDPKELLQFVNRSQDDGRFHCSICEKFSHQNSSCTRNHVESHHFPNIFSYPCDACDQIFDTRTKLNTHKRLKHKKQKQLQ